MIQGVKRKTALFFGAVFFMCFLLVSSNIGMAQDNPVGNIAGFIYAQDEITPIEGAVIKFKNVSTGKFYESQKTDRNGYFAVEGIERGVYLYGVITSEASFDSEGLVGLRIKDNETAKVSIALKPYSSQASQTLEEFYNDLDVSGESYVGRVIEFDVAAKMAQIQVERGFLQQQDRIRAKGRVSDFKQDVEMLESEGTRRNRVFAGQVAMLKMNQPVDIDDMVFVLKKRQFLPFLAAPLGAAAVIAASGAVGYGIGALLQEECEEVSPTKNKKK